MVLKSVRQALPAEYQRPLEVDEVISCLRDRWGVTYDLQLIVRRKKLFFQIMWAYLEQQSFYMDEETYRIHLNEVIDVINRIGQAGEVRNWLYKINEKPRVGRALTFPLTMSGGYKEFLLESDP